MISLARGHDSLYNAVGFVILAHYTMTTVLQWRTYKLENYITLLSTSNSRRWSSQVYAVSWQHTHYASPYWPRPTARI